MVDRISLRTICNPPVHDPSAREIEIPSVPFLAPERCVFEAERQIERQTSSVEHDDSGQPLTNGINNSIRNAITIVVLRSISDRTIRDVISVWSKTV